MKESRVDFQEDEVIILLLLEMKQIIVVPKA